MKQQRVALVIDGPNLYGMNQFLLENFGKKINFSAFLKHITHIVKGRQLVVKRFYYDQHPQINNDNSYAAYMNKMDLETIGVPLKIYSPGPNNPKAVKSRTDNKIIDEVMDLLYNDEFDHLILVSGDSDFQFLLERCKKMKKTVEVWAIYLALAHEIKNTAETFLFEDKNLRHLLVTEKKTKKRAS
ncbi:MAG: NYN domain-containing protein [Candidatus Buchananbacteria bacterium]|nr:NYN domain-containing protein [Candidatus Buchananbacteria bacterium]